LVGGSLILGADQQITNLAAAQVVLTQARGVGDEHRAHGAAEASTPPLDGAEDLDRLFNKHYGTGGDPLTMVAKGTSFQFNSTIPVAEIERALAEDEAKNRAEFLAEFRTDVESFVNADAVSNNCVVRNLYERAPVHGVQYSAAVDPSGGSADSFSMAIGHLDHGRQIVVVDCIRETTPPFNPSVVVEEFARTLVSYDIGVVHGDKYAGMWPTEAFDKVSIRYEQLGRTKSDCYLDLLPMLNSGRIQRQDDPRRGGRCPGTGASSFNIGAHCRAHSQRPRAA
jgi:hypothetical protein